MIMETCFDVPISSMAFHPQHSDQITLGFLDGTVKCCIFNEKNGATNLNEKWRKKLKRAIRGAQYSEDGSALFATSSNRALCMFDTETGKRVRCVREAHKSSPNVVSILPSWIGGQQFFSTGAENGEIKIWDFRQAKSNIAKFNEQEDIINSLVTWKNCLLAASGDGTLAAYDLHKKKLRTQSEAMHSELLSLAVTTKLTYVGAADGHIEVFKNSQFGNILERIETPFVMGVEQLLAVRDNLLLAGASTEEKIGFVHVDPNKVLDGGIPFPGGTDLLGRNGNNSFLAATSGDGTRLKMFPLESIINEVPELKAQDMHTFKKTEKEKRKKGGPASEDFFKDLVVSEEEEQSDEDDEEESILDSSEEEEDDSNPEDEVE